MASASDALFVRLAALGPAAPAASWRELLAADAFADPASLIRALPPARDRASVALLLAAKLAEQVESNSELDEHFLEALRPFWFAVATVNLTDWQFWHSPRQPLRRVLHQLLLLGRGYSLSAHPASVQFPQRLHNRLQALAEQAVAGAGAAQLLLSLKSLYELLRQVHEQQRQSDRRLVEQEEQSRRTLHAQSQASRAIRQQVWGQPVPASVVDFLDDTWRKYLYMLHLRLGMEHPSWQQAVADIKLMVWLASEASPAELTREVTGELPGLLRRIREALAQTRTDEDGQQFPEVFAGLLAARARNQPDAGLPLGELADEADEFGATTAGQAIHFHRLPERGDCLLLKQQNNWQRVRVVTAPTPHDYLLLADFAGGRIATLSPLELQTALQDDRLRQLADRDPVVQLLPELPQLLRPLLDNASQEQALLRAQTLQQQQQAAADALRQRETERAAAFELRKQQEAAARAERVAEGRRQAEQASLLAKQREQGLALIDSLRSGALVEIRRDDNHYRACYLAMIRAADQLYVFVDRQGQKVAEHNRDALLALVLSDGIRVTESGSALDSTLQNLVSERRQFLNEEDGT